VGPTASGKTGLAVKIASLIGGEIISADSRQVYRGMDIGTGKDLHEYVSNNRSIPYHLIDIVDPRESFSVFDYQALAYSNISSIWARGNMPILCGGTGMYVDSVLRRYRMTRVPENPELRRILDSLPTEALVERLLAVSPSYHTTGDFRKRPRLIRAIEIAEFSLKNKEERGEALSLRPVLLYIEFPRDELRERIRIRLDERLSQGMIDEVRQLVEQGVTWDRLDTFGLEYRYIARYLRGEMELAIMRERLYRAICQFAKRQETWFRGMERKGISLHRLIRGNWNDVVAFLMKAGLVSS